MNPELRRNLWLELTTHRLVAMPAVLLLVFALFFFTETENWRTALFGAATGVFVVLVHLWGTRQASDAVTDEVRERTWDWQRLSALTPWQMAWGKLFGATAFTWYGAAWCVIAMIATSIAYGIARTMWLALVLVASGLAIHGGAMAASLQASRKDSRLGHRIGTALLLPALFGAAAFFAFATRAGASETRWFGRDYDAIVFTAVSVTLFAAWGVLGAYREMARELKLRQLPWAWPAFALFLAAYCAGFFPSAVGAAPGFVMAGLFSTLGLTYYALFTDYMTAMTLRRLVARAGTGDWKYALQELPLWGTTLALAIPFAIVAPWALAEALPFGSWPRVITLFPLAMVLMAVRDAGIMVFFTLSKRPRRVEGVTMLYIVLLAWVIPGLLKVTGLGLLAALVMPFGSMGGWQAALAMGVQAAIAWAGVAWRWRKV